MIVTIVVVVLLPLVCHSFLERHLSQGQRTRRLFVDTPSWRGDSLTTTPPTVEEVVEEVTAAVRCLFVAVEALSFDDTVVRCLCCLADGVEALIVDDVEVVSAVCCTDGHEGLNKDDVEVVIADCHTDGVVALTPDGVADR